MAKKKKSVRRAWTPSDVRELKSLAKKKVGVAKISKALKRTVGATAVKAFESSVQSGDLDPFITGKLAMKIWAAAARAVSGTVSLKASRIT